jgi:hypothetical protein
MIKTRISREGGKFAGQGTLKKYFQMLRAEVNGNKWTILLAANGDISYENNTRNDMIPQWIELFARTIKNSIMGGQ